MRDLGPPLILSPTHPPTHNPHPINPTGGCGDQLRCAHQQQGLCAPRGPHSARRPLRALSHHRHAGVHTLLTARLAAHCACHALQCHCMSTCSLALHGLLLPLPAAVWCTEAGSCCFISRPPGSVLPLSPCLRPSSPQYDVELYQKIEALIGLRMEAYPAEQEAVLLLLERVGEAQRIATMQASSAPGPAMPRCDGALHAVQCSGDSGASCGCPCRASCLPQPPLGTGLLDITVPLLPCYTLADEGERQGEEGQAQGWRRR